MKLLSHSKIAPCPILSALWGVPWCTLLAEGGSRVALLAALSPNSSARPIPVTSGSTSLRLDLCSKTEMTSFSMELGSAVMTNYDPEKVAAVNALEPECDDVERANIKILQASIFSAVGFQEAGIPADVLPMFSRTRILQFGRARQWDMAKSTSMFVDMLKWYRSHMTDYPAQIKKQAIGNRLLRLIPQIPFVSPSGRLGKTSVVSPSGTFDRVGMSRVPYVK